MLREIIYALGGLLVLAYTLDFTLGLFDDPREPPRIPSKIPVLGHVFGLLRHGTGYYGIVSKQTKAEIYTLNMVLVKIYVSNTQRLTPIIQRSSRTLSFRPVIQTMSKIIGDASDETHALFGGDLVDAFSQGMRTALLPGPKLDEQNLRMGTKALSHLDDLVVKGDQSESVMLLEWVKHVVVHASSTGVFGQQHPFLDPNVEKAFWTWADYEPQHIANMDLFRTGYAARDIVFEAFRKYCKALPTDVAEVVLERQRVLREAGVSEEDRAKQEASFCTAVFPNTTPTLYWSIYELFSRPDILEEVRNELVANAVSRSSTSKGDQHGDFVLDVAALKTRCPLLLSMYQETQRTRSINALVRKVLDDTLLDGRYLLKKGNFLMVPSQPIHNSTATWGASAENFDAHRFTPKSDTPADGNPTNGVGGGGGGSGHASHFMAWGAAPYLCPARQFASTEILIVLALMAMRTDLRPIGGWEKNPDVVTGDISTVLNPVKDVRLEVGVRKDWVGQWRLEMGESRTKVPIASG